MTTTDIAKMFLLDFERMANAFDFARSGEVKKYVGHYPPVDIIRKDNNWLIQVALAGYCLEDIEVSTDNNQLIVKVNKEEKTDPKLEYMFKGISSRNFERRWQLDHDMEIVGTSFDNGMLTIGVTKIVPEAKKPKKLEIGSSNKDLTKLIA